MRLNDFNVSMSSSVNTSAMNLSSIEPLNGGNFKKSKQDIEIVLGMMDLDLALRDDEPAPVDENLTTDQRLKFKKWEKANRMSLMVMKRAMGETVMGGITACDKAKEFLDAVSAKFKESEKAEMGDLMTTLTTLKLDENKSVREHILKLVETTAKLKDLEVLVDDAFIIHMVLNSLPPKFDQLKTFYDTQKEKWTLDELIFIFAQEEARIRRNEICGTVNLVQADKGKRAAYYPGKVSKPDLNYTNANAAMYASSSKGPMT
ncbi:uncharacterized protein [Pyrus communis]|uniref:uncharacterized protein n=1 Tax=Pyrus communis TaxID=23211 RepID=UPI0035BF4EB3